MTKQGPIPRLLITAGEPAGIGPELCLSIAQAAWDAHLVVCADQTLLEHYNQLYHLGVEIIPWQITDDLPPHQANRIYCHHVPMADNNVPGQLNVNNGSYVLQTLSTAVDLVMSEVFDALVTAPVHKGIINDAGFSFSGHTEFLADKSSGESVMMLTCPDFRVALVTTHLPLKDVSAAVTEASISRVVRILDTDLKRKYGIKQPVIHVCGLNPHAGEGGHLGMEEIDTIIPTLEKLRAEGYQLNGPLPADTALTPKGMRGADATLAMYHDQGLSVLKYAGFGDSVNVTLGLPFIRVSVDHGTAIDIAGKNCADPGSLKAAINEALIMTRAQLSS